MLDQQTTIDPQQVIVVFSCYTDDPCATVDC